MHKYLRSVGFSELMNSYDRLNLIDDIKTKSSYHMQAAILDNPEEMLTEYKMDLAGGCGLTMAGTFEDENEAYPLDVPADVAKASLTDLLTEGTWYTVTFETRSNVVVEIRELE